MVGPSQRPGMRRTVGVVIFGEGFEIAGERNILKRN